MALSPSDTARCAVHAGLNVLQLRLRAGQRSKTARRFAFDQRPERGVGSPHRLLAFSAWSSSAATAQRPARRPSEISLIGPAPIGSDVRLAEHECLMVRIAARDDLLS